MDTSSWEVVWYLQGKKEMPIGEIPPDALLYVVEEIYRKPLIASLSYLYRSIGAQMSGRGAFYGTIPRGITVFEKGLGINTKTLSMTSSERLSGEQLFPDTPRVWSCADTDLLLLVPQTDDNPHTWCAPKWARWSLQFIHTKLHNRPKHDDIRWSKTVTKSEVHWLKEGEVIAAFKQKPSLGTYFLHHVRDFVPIHAEKLEKKARELRHVSFETQAILGHVSY
jgi:hypothetical protein